MPPIAVGNEFRSFASKSGGHRFYSEWKNSSGTLQLAFGTPGGADAGVHAKFWYYYDRVVPRKSNYDRQVPQACQINVIAANHAVNQ